MIIKPTGPVSVKRGRLLSTYQNNWQDLAGSGRPANRFGTAILRTRKGRQGFFRSGTGELDGYITYPNNNVIYGSGELTVFTVLHFTTVPGSTSNHHDVICQKSYTSGVEPYYVIQLKRANTSGSNIGSIQLQFNLGGVRIFLGTTATANAGVYTVVVSIKNGLQYIFVFDENGEIFDFNEAANTGGGVTNYATSMYVGGQNLFPTWVYSSAIFYELFGVDNVAWSKADILEFGRDPYSFVLNFDQSKTIAAPSPYISGARIRDRWAGLGRRY